MTINRRRTEQVWHSLLVLISVSAALVQRSFGQAELLHANGVISRAVLTRAESDRGYTFVAASNNGATKTLATKKFVRWGEPVRPPVKPFLILSDGSELILERQQDVRHLTNDRITFRSDTFGSVLISIDSIRAIVFQSPRELVQRDRLTRRLMSKTPGLDELALASGDVLRGRLESFDGQSVTFSSDGRKRIVARKLIAMIALDPRFAARPMLEPHAIVGLTDGHKLLAKSIDIEDDLLYIELFDGTLLKTASYIRPIEDRTIAFVQPVGLHVRYLSDLQPKSFKHIPFLSGEWPYGLDRDIHGRHLVSADGRRRSAKGVALHSTSRISFDLPDGFTRFDAELAIAANEDDHLPAGSVIYRVFLKDGSGWREAFKSPTVRQSTRQIECRVPLVAESGTATEISLVADFADRADQGDHALWLDARLVR